jgi:hypothetical protein
MKASKRATAKGVREPVQVYLDERDRDLLEELTARSALSRAELLRLGLRRLSAEMLTEGKRGGSLDSLIGVLDAAPQVPRNLAAKHDDYLYGKSKKGDARRR